MSRSSTPLVLVVVALLTAPIAGAANGTPTALTLRGQALNQAYHLGAYADRTGSSFPWLAAVFAAAAAVGVILAAFAGTVGVRRRRAVIAL
jgi:hypothetical protein